MYYRHRKKARLINTSNLEIGSFLALADLKTM